MANAKELNDLVKWAANPTVYKKKPKECLDEFFKKVNISDFDPSKYQKNITDYYENALYKNKYKNELTLELNPYHFHDALLTKSQELIKSAQLKEAIPYLESALEWNPVSRKATYLICKIYFSLHKFNKAFEYAVKGLDIEFNGKYIAYYFSVFTLYYLKRQNYLKADEYASGLYLLNNKDNATLKYLENRGIKQITPAEEKNEEIMDALLAVVYDEKIIKEERARHAQILLSYEIMPIFKYEKFYLTLETGIKNAELKDSVIVNGNYLLAGIDGKKYLDIKDKKHLFEKLIIHYFDKINELNLYIPNLAIDKNRYENEPLLEEIKIKFNGKLYYIANTSTNKEMADLYLDMKTNILKLASIMVHNKPTINDLFKFKMGDSND